MEKLWAKVIATAAYHARASVALWCDSMFHGSVMDGVV
jgi:hypothetical protein